MFARAVLAPFSFAMLVAAWAVTAHADGDAARGQTLAYTCLGCHANSTYKNVYPTYSVPKLRGQTPEYLVASLLAYQQKERSHATMHAQVATMSQEDIADIAVYLAGEPVKSTGKPVGKAPEAAQVCVSCHGTDGVGIVPDYPTLAGQHADYLERGLYEYQDGGRKNAIMVGFAATLTDADIKALAEYYSKQTPGLTTVPRTNTRFSAR